MAEESLLAQMSYLDYAIVMGLIAASTYWFLFKKKDTRNEFDASSIKTFSLEPTTQASGSNSGFIAKMKSGVSSCQIVVGAGHVYANDHLP